jgi:AcrR family transcriptional regulator
MRSLAAPARRDARRENSERRIVEAFGRIVARDGLYQVRVNKLMREAGVGKKQLYQYFGDLSGVARAWTAAGMPAPVPPSAEPTRHTRAGSRVTRLTLLLRDYAEALRSNPAIFASLHAELGGPRDLRQPFDEIRAGLLREQVQYFLENPYMRAEEYTALYSVLYAAINYLALRARFAPAFNGLDLSTPAGWTSALGMVETVAAMSEAGLKRQPARRPNRKQSPPAVTGPRGAKRRK